MTNDVEQTFDHTFHVERVYDTLAERGAVLVIRDRDGDEKRVKLTPHENEFQMTKDIRIVLIGIHAVPNKRGGVESTLRLGFDAPRSYRIVRDDAIKRSR